LADGVIHRLARNLRSPAHNLFRFDEHYTLSRTYVQELVLNRISVPSIDGGHCPTVVQDAEQNALYKAILFSPWFCPGAIACGSVLTYRNVLSNGSCPCGGSCEDTDIADGRGSSGEAVAHAQHSSRQAKAYTFERAWRLRHAEVNVLASRADARRETSRKHLAMSEHSQPCRKVPPVA